jgi:hypothetical protein
MIETAVAVSNGFLYCKSCDDFVYDQTLEGYRMRKGRSSATRTRFSRSRDSRRKEAQAGRTYTRGQSTGLC